jgi:hypothetical protein
MCGLQVVVLGSCFLALNGGSSLRWYILPHASEIGIATPLSATKHGIDCIHLV